MFAYQWHADSTPIAGATNPTYTLTGADAAKTVTVTVTFADDNANAETATSAPTAPIAWSATCGDNAHKISGLAADTVSHDSFSVSWTALGCPGDYLIRHWQTHDQHGTLTALTVTRSETTHTATGLTAATSYTVRVLYQDPDGGRPWKATPPLEITTLATPQQQQTPPPQTPTAKIVAGPAQTEGGYGTFVIQLDPAPTAPIDVQVSVTQTGDHAKPGQTGTRTVTVPVLGHKTLLVGTHDDTADEPDGTITVTVQPGTGYTVAAAPHNTGTIAIADNDNPPTQPNSPATGAPTITGTAQVGQTLTADTSAIADADGLGAFSYQWHADSTPITGATGTTHTLTSADQGKTITVTVSFTDSNGHAETLTSTPTSAVTAKPNSPATGAPTISGTAQVGQTLTADTSAIADADGLGTFSYEWLADGNAITGATGSSHTLTSSEQGKAIRVRVSFTDGNGHAETVTSTPTSAVAAKPNSPATGAPTITGTAQVGQTLTAGTTAIADADGLGTFSYQWLADGSAISGATGVSHALTSSEQGKAIRVTVSFTDGDGNAETVTSTPTDAVTAKPATAKPGLSVSDAEVREDASPDGQHLEFRISLDKPAQRYVFVSYRTRDQTASIHDFDYFGVSGSVFFKPGDQHKTVRVYVPPDDGNAEGRETMQLVITSALGAPIADSTGTGTITD